MTNIAAAAAAKTPPVSDLYELVGNLIPASRAYLTGGIIIDALRHPNEWVDIEDLVSSSYLRDLEAQVNQLGDQFAFNSRYEAHCAPRRSPDGSKVPFHRAKIRYTPSAT